MNLYSYRIVREKTESYYDGRKSLNNPETVHEVLKDYYNKNFDMDKEHFTVILLNTKNQAIGINLVSMGTINQALVHPREVFRPAILTACNSIILCHNHPSGDVKPSKEDIHITERLIEAGKHIGIKVLDHLIIGDEKFISLHEAYIVTGW